MTIGRPDHVRGEKSALRAQFRAYRESLSAADYDRISRAVVDRVTPLPEIRRAANVHVYWPMTERREIDTRRLIQHLHDLGKEIVLPIVVTLDPAGWDRRRLAHVRFSGIDDLRVNRWGITEPSYGETVPAEDLDVVIVPSLGAGRDGSRLGHGFGFYDEFLAGLTAPKICLVYDACLVDAVPSETHDVRMDVLVSERTVRRLAR